MTKDLYEASLSYHETPKPGKIAVVPTKNLATQRDLSLAYTPGVAAVCEAIHKNPHKVYDYTAKSNLVAVITNGTAILGLGHLGPLAAKPVMEGKAVLFKKFAGIDVFDIEMNETDPHKLVEHIASLEPTFGGINLEDIKAPECFYVERTLQKRLNIPVFHDDQHGTAIIVAAAILNGLRLVKKDIHQVKLAMSGAGAAALACLHLLELMGLQRSHIFVADIDGVVHDKRTVNMDPEKAKYSQSTPHRTLSDIIEEADIFVGLSAGNIVTEAMITSMAPNPIILALANPIPEIDPALVKSLRPDAIMGTGRSDFDNQVNNVLCFPFIFRGALDVGARCINDAMKLAAVHAIAGLARTEISDVVNRAYGHTPFKFGPNYIIPKPFDPRLIACIAPAVARAACDTGVATRPLKDFEAYRQHVSQYVFKSGLAMKPIFVRAKENPKRVVFSDGEEERVLRAVQDILDENMAHPILIGRRRIIEKRLERLGLRLVIDKDFQLVDPEEDLYSHHSEAYHRLMQRHGVSPDSARVTVRTNTTVMAALMVYLNEAHAMIAGPTGQYKHHLEDIRHILGHTNHLKVTASLSILVLDRGLYFFTDGYVNEDPTAQDIALITQMAAIQVKEFGFSPKIALVSHSNFGTSASYHATKLQKACQLLHEQAPHLEVDGEMSVDAALDPDICKKLFPNSVLKGEANLLVMPTIDAANIAFNMAKILADGQSIGPLLMGLSKSAHILTPSVTVRSILNMTAFAVNDACRHENDLKDSIV